MKKIISNLKKLISFRKRLNAWRHIYFYTHLQRNEAIDFRIKILNIDNSMTKDEILNQIKIANNEFDYNTTNGSTKYFNENKKQISVAIWNLSDN
jgi:hypothetical protein